jgi:hypothetical protein
MVSTKHQQGKEGRHVATDKKTWQRPQLTVLVRVKPEEAVLLTCKGDNTTVGPKGKKGTDNCAEMGTACSSIGAS